jgi:hypothetical protein
MESYNEASPRSMTQAWLLNFRKYMGTISERDRQWMPIGTTANEQVHRELNQMMDNVHDVHLPVLELKLDVFLLYKLFPHNRALLNPGVRQLSQAVMLNRLVHSLRPWTVDGWTEWCMELVQDEYVHTASLPAAIDRTKRAAVVRRWNAAAVAKRPAIAKASAGRSKRRIVKRTAFTKVTGLKRLLSRKRASE